MLRAAPFARDLLQDSGSASITVERNGVEETQTGFQVEWLSAQNEQARAPYAPKNPPNARRISLTPASALDNPISTLFIATKAQSVLPSLSLLRSRLTNDSTIVFLQNGAGTVEEVVENLFQDANSRPSFLIGSVSHGCYKKANKSRLHTIWASLGEIVWACIPSKAAAESIQTRMTKPLNPLLDSSSPISPSLADHVPLTPSTQSLYLTINALLACESLNPQWLSLSAFQTKQLQKLAVNAVINPLTALLNVKNGYLLRASNYSDLTVKICQEASLVFAAQMNENKPFEGSHPLSVQSLATRVKSLTKATGKNVSSTLADLRHKSQETEL